MRIKVGQKVWLEDCSKHGRKRELFKQTIKKVGRKYFHVSGTFHGERFLISDLKYDGYSGKYNCYLTEQEYLDKYEKLELIVKIKKEINPKNDINDIRKIARMLGIWITEVK